MSEIDLDHVKALLRRLESDDAFERRDAIESLAVLTQQRLDYRWSADANERRRAVRRWRRWVAREERERRGRSVQTVTELLSGGKLDQKTLQEALQGLPPQQKKALMAQVLAKVSGLQGAAPQGLPVCESCERRPATAQLTERDEATGAFECRLLCEICVQRAER